MLNALAGFGSVNIIMCFAVLLLYNIITKWQNNPDYPYIFISAYLAICIKCTYLFSRIFARLRVELGVGVSFDTMYHLIHCLSLVIDYISNVESRDSEEGDGKVKEV